MCHSRCRKCVNLVLDRQVLLDPGFWFVEVEFGIEGFEPRVSFFLVGNSSIFRDGVLDDSKAIFEQICSPIMVFGSGCVTV